MMSVLARPIFAMEPVNVRILSSLAVSLKELASARVKVLLKMTALNAIQPTLETHIP